MILSRWQIDWNQLNINNKHNQTGSKGKGLKVNSSQNQKNWRIKTWNGKTFEDWFEYAGHKITLIIGLSLSLTHFAWWQCLQCCSAACTRGHVSGVTALTQPHVPHVQPQPQPQKVSDNWQSNFHRDNLATHYTITTAPMIRSTQTVCVEQQQQRP